MQLAGVGRPPGSHFSAGAGGTDRSVARRSGRGRTTQQLHTPHGACWGYRAGFSAWPRIFQNARAVLMAFSLNTPQPGFGV